MSVPAMLGAEWGDFARDKVTIIAAGSYDTVTPPPDSASVRYFRGQAFAFRYPWLTHTGAEITPAGNEFWYFLQYRTAANSASFNDTAHLGVGRNATKQIGVSFQDSTNKYTIKVADVVRATATSAAISVNVWTRFAVHVSGYTEGSTVKVYIDGDLSAPVVEYTLIAADASALSGKPNEFYTVHKSGSTEQSDDFFLLDPGDGILPTDPEEVVFASIKPFVPTGNGNYTAWTGDYTAVDEVPPSDGDAISTSTVDTAETFTFPALGQDRVFSVKVSGRVTRVGSDAGVNMDFRRRTSSTDYDVGPVAAPGDGEVSIVYTQKPGGGAWSATDFDNCEFGWVART